MEKINRRRRGWRVDVKDEVLLCTARSFGVRLPEIIAEFNAIVFLRPIGRGLDNIDLSIREYC